MSRQTDRGLAAVRKYYDATRLDYRFLWLNRRDQAMHFGYWSPGIGDHSESLVEMNRVLADRVGIGPGDTVFDAGCGVGGSAIWLALERGARVMGLSPVPRQVADARRNARRSGAGDAVSFAVGDYAATDFDAGRFSVAWFLESLCHAPDKAAVLREAYRLLAPGGRIAICEYVRTRRPLDVGGEALLGAWLHNWAIPDIATAEELTDWARDAGFDDIEATDVTDAVRPSLERLHRITARLAGAEAALHRLHLRSDWAHANTVGAFNQLPALDQGLWRYLILSARRPDAGPGATLAAQTPRSSKENAPWPSPASRRSAPRPRRASRMP
ncbi:MAG: SAM-dependent methyltransferase [Candidatus Limnocylindrales bacterium]